MVLLGLGGFALAGALLLLGAAGANAWHKYVAQKRWPLVRATIENCGVDSRARRRSPGRYVTYLQCSVTFTDANGQRVKGGFQSQPTYYEHRNQSWANPGIDELRAWAAHHASGTEVMLHCDPHWPPSTEPGQPAGDLRHVSHARVPDVRRVGGGGRNRADGPRLRVWMG